MAWHPLSRRSVVVLAACMLGAAPWSGTARAMVPAIIITPPPIRTFQGPAITAISPTAGSYDTQVTITGSDLAGVKEVDFGGVSATYVEVVSDTTILAGAPRFAAGSTVPVTVPAPPPFQQAASPTEFSYEIGQVSVTGPLPWDVSQLDGGTYDWNATHFYDLASPGSIAVATASPAFDVHAFFQDDSGTYPSHIAAPFAIGNRGHFTALLQLCDLTGTPGHGVDEGGACTNFDGNTGVWKTMDSAQQTLLSAGPDQSSDAEIVLTAGGALDLQHMAATFRIVIFAGLDDTRTSIGSWADSRIGPSFNVVLSPTALIQLQVLPYTILYQPPGDQSTASFATTTSYGTALTAGTSTTTSNSSADASSSSVTLAVKVGFPSYLGADLSLGQKWDNTVTQGFGTVASTTAEQDSTEAFASKWSLPADVALVPGSGQTCASAADCSSLTPTPNTYANEPFWRDRFLLLIHPQFAVWVLGGRTKYVMLGAVPVLGEATTAQLAACADGVTLVAGIDPCAVPYSDANLTSGAGGAVLYSGNTDSVKLTSAEAQHLVALDPFYEEGGQSAKLDTKRATLIASASYGAQAGSLPVPYEQDLSNLSVQRQTVSNTTTYDASTTSVVGSSLTVDGSISSGFVTNSLQYTEGQTTTTTDDLKVSYQNTTAVINQKATSVTGMLNDVDNTVQGGGGPVCKACHGPLPAQPSTNIYLDRTFGGFMYQDPAAPAAPQHFMQSHIAVIARFVLLRAPSGGG